MGMFIFASAALGKTDRYRSAPTPNVCLVGNMQTEDLYFVFPMFHIWRGKICHCPENCV